MLLYHPINRIFHNFHFLWLTGANGLGPGAAGLESGEIGTASRGQRRGSRVINEMLHTRPASVADSKKGSIGQMVALKANYFKFSTKPTWSIFQYEIEFSPTIDVTMIIKRLKQEHQ